MRFYSWTEGKPHVRDLTIILVTSLLGILISCFLVHEHYAPPGTSSLCNLSETISCALVNGSYYSTIFGTPVAAYGALWYCCLTYFCVKAVENQGNRSNVFIHIIFIWAVVGAVVAIYLIMAEVILWALCPWCTVLHVTIFLILGLSARMKRKERIGVDFVTAISACRTTFLVISAIFLMTSVYYNTAFSEPDADYVDVARCITSHGYVMYGSSSCSHCQNQKRLIGPSAFQFIKFIECSVAGTPEHRRLCQQRDIVSYPTWIQEVDHNDANSIAENEEKKSNVPEISQQNKDDIHEPRQVESDGPVVLQRHEGVQTVKQLALLAKCMKYWPD